MRPFLNYQLSKLGEIEQMAKNAFYDEKKKNEEALRELPILERIAYIKRGISDGGRQMGNVLGGALVGETETDRTINQTRSAFGAMGNANIAGSGRNMSSADVGAIYVAEELARQNILELATKQYRLEADIRNLPYERIAAEKQLTAELVKQNEEASKRLQLAGRDDQLRSAALSRTLRDSGGVTSSEFQFLSQSSKQSFQTYRPDALPGDLNEQSGGRGEINKNLSKRGQEIEMELAKIRDQLPSLRNTMKGFEDAITGARGKGGTMDIIPLEHAPGLMDKMKSMFSQNGQVMPPVNVDVRGMQVKVQISDDVERVVSKVLREAVAGDLKAMERRLDEKLARSGIPTGQSVVE